MKSIEEYSLMVKKLKVKIKDLESKNEVLQSSLGMPTQFEPKIPNFLYIFQQGTSELYIKESILKELKKNCEERGMSLEMLYRCADVDQEGQVQVTQMQTFLQDFYQGQVAPSLLMRISLLFDEDHSGSISRDEFYRTLVYSKCNGEEPQMSDQAPKINAHIDTRHIDIIQEEVLQKFIDVIRQANQSSEMIYARIDSQGHGFVTATDLQVALGPAGFNSNQILVLMKYFDVRSTNNIMRDDFLDDLKEIQIPNIQAQALIQMKLKNPGSLILAELRTFRAILKKYDVNPIIAFHKCMPRDADRKTVTDLAEVFAKVIPLREAQTTPQQILKWMKLIDTSGDGCVDQQELRLSLLTEDDLQNQLLSVEVASQPTTDVQMVLLKMTQQGITVDQFFEWMDTNKDGMVSLVELRKGLLALKLQMGDALQIMKAFDTNKDGQIDVVEFYEAFGFMAQANTISMKRAATKLKTFFDGIQMDFVAGLKELFFAHLQPNEEPIISREEFLISLDRIAQKATLSDNEVYKMMEVADQGATNQIELISYCNYLYFLLFPQ